MDIVNNFRIGGKIVAGRILKKAVPLSVELGITYQCMQACRYCPPVGDRADYLTSAACPAKIEMPLEQIQKVLWLLGRLGVERVNLSGGEPLFRKDIGPILKSASLFGGKISLTTNGVLVSQYLDFLQELDFLIISINGTQKTHDFLAGVSVHEVVMNAIAEARNRGIQVLLSAVVTAHTTEDDLAFLLKLADYYGTYCVFQPVCDGGYFDEGYLKYKELISVVPSLAHLEALFQFLKHSPYRKRVVGGRDFIEFILNWSRERSMGASFLTQCDAGKSFFYISPSGEFYPCSLRFQRVLKKKFYEYTVEEFGMSEIKDIKCAGCSCYSNNVLGKISRLDMGAIIRHLVNQYV